jgi:hypothetical protein
MAHLTFLVIFNLKEKIVKILIYHIVMVITLKTIHLWYENYQIFHMVHKHILIIWNHNVQINITNLKIKNHFNHFLNIFSVFSILWHTFCFHKYILISYQIKQMIIIFLHLISLGFDPSYYAKKLLISFIIMTWLKFKHGTLEK